MRTALGLVLMLLGVAILALLAAFVHWAHAIFTVTFNQRFELTLIAAAAVGGACVAAGVGVVASVWRPAGSDAA